MPDFSSPAEKAAFDQGVLAERIDNTRTRLQEVERDARDGRADTLRRLAETERGLGERLDRFGDALRAQESRLDTRVTEVERTVTNQVAVVQHELAALRQDVSGLEGRLLAALGTERDRLVTAAATAAVRDSLEASKPDVTARVLLLAQWLVLLLAAVLGGRELVGHLGALP